MRFKIHHTLFLVTLFAFLIAGCSSQEQTGCPEIYQPVCGEVEVQCITAPCDPIKTTFENECFAQEAGATNLVAGECKEEINVEGACLSFDGTWLENSQECEWMGQEQCEELGGKHNECASPCRNDPSAEICILQCVSVCSFS